jgi:hypothetical protein
MLHVLTKSGEKLFSGTRHEVKKFIRANRIKNYVLKGQYIEKVAVTKEDVPTNPLSEPEEVSIFNKVFDEEDD